MSAPLCRTLPQTVWQRAGVSQVSGLRRWASSGAGKRELQKSFPIFSNRAGVIECNKSFVYLEYPKDQEPRKQEQASNVAPGPSAPHSAAAEGSARSRNNPLGGSKRLGAKAQGSQGSSWTTLEPETPLLAQELKGWVPLDMRSRTQQAFGKVSP